MKWNRDSECDAGNITVLTACVISALTMILVWVLCLTSLISDAHQVRSAADLAALAGAQELGASESQACAIALEVAQFNGAELLDCHVRGTVLEIAVSRSTRNRSVHRVVPTVKAMARAGY